MELLIKALATYGPRIKLGATVGITELVLFLAGRTNTHKGELELILDELQQAVFFFNRIGRAVKKPGLGIYSPGMKRDGNIKVGHRADPALKKRFNDSHGFEGDVINKDMVGKTLDDVIEKWNTENPNDAVAL